MGKKYFVIATQEEASHPERASTFPLHRAQLGVNKASDFPVTWFHML